MALLADLTAWTMQRTAARSARYGDDLHLDGTDLPEPRVLRVPTRHGDVRCEVYRPRGEPTGVYVHLHGGAFVMRYPRMDDFFARFVAARAGAVVVNVDYDVAPQKRYPVAQEQAHDVLVAVADEPETVGAPPGSAVAVGGFSAGGNLAASACLQARDLGTVRPALQVLGVPSLDVAEPVQEKVSRAPQAMVGTQLLRLVRATYFRDAARRREPYASPLLADDLSGLPPAVVLTAERDSLRAEGDAYAARLAGAGVDVVHRVVPRRDHYFLDGADPAQAEGLMLLVTDRLREAFQASDSQSAERPSFQ